MVHLLCVCHSLKQCVLCLDVSTSIVPSSGGLVYTPIMHIKILTCVCVSVCDGSGMFVGRDKTSDAQPSYFNHY